ncbi:MAG: nitrogen regulatory protein P-II 1 [Methanohalophilus sp. T328-1]|jgi:nitrogen regulatory protein P-II 1|uniref:Nitrogen regulatory protein P-II family n=1 Tax=Methanohalophilus euhalobius TaxID=51203 RepID=A0A285FY80_9EURY|nr:MULTISPECIES: P-II family nitrogen regulator [Methanohalophilus]KXS43183.1 MAG: nitrogen regulatory protein P-II 1 [Methanohalophilus sp. T328-1]RSD33224.1 MAG: nitrogen regulatory protein P-II 1 [Methanohalophilus sp.]OBZ34614.1 MAG: transcriptional regulator [Methanohalophilus sp. DAL1]ODV50330.1 MAG: nitrogen regulatory protein P-II 1 [Methanohalophilus sp. 2-GBenrich]RSD36212.1 MAG: nitrogen regulatory protein P-II 1 [Methanohalophilus sp.]
MYKVEAIIKPTKLHEVKDSLEEAGFASLTVTEVKGRGQQKGMVQQWRGRKYCVDLLPKTKIEIVLSEDEIDEVVELIRKTASTGEIGDGKIFIYPVKSVVRIRTGEKDGDAL